MSLQYSRLFEKRRKFLACSFTLLFVTLITIGVFAKNNWFPSTDALSGKRTGWFGNTLPPTASSSWNPFAAPLPTPAPELSKEYIYAGQRLLAVEDTFANAAPPADLAVWRPSTGTWWVMGGSNSQQVSQAWGTSGDKPVPGDYDGDGKTDFSIFRPSSSQWFVLQSSDSAWAPVITWGTSNDVRVPADYDGDGKTDRAVWRPSDGIWYIVRSSDQSSYYQTYGTNGDVPAPADYDGDGRADIAVWRNSEQKFYSINSSDSAMSVVSVSQSSTQPVSADYDGDGKTDIATWRNSNGNWYIRQTANRNSLRQVQWGISGDIPIPAFYRR